MVSAFSHRTPNAHLKYERERRGWTQSDVANALCHLCSDSELDEHGFLDAKRVSTWELGKHTPSHFWRVKLCQLFEKTVEELRLVAIPESGEASSELEVFFPPSYVQLAAPNFTPRAGTAFPLDGRGDHHAYSPYSIPMHLTRHQIIDAVLGRSEVSFEQQQGAWLALSACDLNDLFDEQWSFQDIVTALQIVHKGVKAMHKLSRRNLFERGAAAIISGIAIPTGRHASFEERSQLCSALGESIAAGWSLFHTAGNAQVLAVSHAQLLLVQQASSQLYQNVRPMYYSGVYRLMGAALYFQGRYEEADQKQDAAYAAALEGADVWNMAQSRSWQAYGFKARGCYLDALQTADAALRLISQQQDRESVRLRARLLALSAENAALLSDVDEVQRRLAASEELLEHLPGQHEEFDRVSWLQQAGMCALSLKQYERAGHHLQQAFDELPAQWTLRSVSTALPLATVLTTMRARDEALALARKTLPVVASTQSSPLKHAFCTFLLQELYATFPDDECKTFVGEAQRQLAVA